MERARRLGEQLAAGAAWRRWRSIMASIWRRNPDRRSRRRDTAGAATLAGAVDLGDHVLRPVRAHLARVITDRDRERQHVGLGLRVGVLDVDERELRDARPSESGSESATVADLIVRALALNQRQRGRYSGSARASALRSSVPSMPPKPAVTSMRGVWYSGKRAAADDAALGCSIENQKKRGARASAGRADRRSAETAYG